MWKPLRLMMPSQLNTWFAEWTYPLLCLVEVFVDSQGSLKPPEEVKSRREVGDGFIGKMKWWAGRFLLINCKAVEKRNIQPTQKQLVAKNSSLNQVTENILSQVKPFSRCGMMRMGPECLLPLSLEPRHRTWKSQVLLPAHSKPV